MSNFTSQELDLASDPTILLIKYRMMEKVWDFLSKMQAEIRVDLNSFERKLPEELNLKNGKLSKGENYKHLPYMMLDFPAFFTKKDILAFRTMFYWGHFFSSTFHLQGKFLQKYGSALLKEFTGSNDVYFCVNSSPWEYHYQPSNFVKLSELNQREIDKHCHHTDFLKLSIKYPVEEMADRKNDLIQFLLKGLKVIQTI